MTAPCPTFGFAVAMDVDERAAAARDALRRAWIDFLGGRGLYSDALGGGSRLECVVASEASQATENDRVAAQEWLAARPELRGWRVGPLEDLGERP